MSKTTALSLLYATLLTLGGCEREGVVEQAGESIDEAVEDVRDEAEDIREETEELVDEARDN